MILSSFILMILNILFYMISYKNFTNFENLTSYECGFDLISQTRSFFSYRFFLISILFLIFDVEIALMLPIPYFSGIMMMLTFLMFLFILIVGLLYEYKYGMLDWL